MIASENDISFLEAFEVVKTIDSTFDKILGDIAYEIKDLNYEISKLGYDKERL